MMNQKRRQFIALLTAGGTVLPRVTFASDAEWKSLQKQVEFQKAKLAELIRTARRKNITADYAEVSYQVISLFQVAAQHDYDHMDRVVKIFKGYWPYPKIDPVHTEQLPQNELKACLEIADFAMADLKMQLDRKIRRAAPPELDSGKMVLRNGYYEIDGRVVFPSSLVWTPREEFALNSFGRLGGGYLQQTHMHEDGSPGSHLQSSIESLQKQREMGMRPFVFLTGHNVPGWMKKKHPEVLYGGRNFVEYDIDSPIVRDGMQKLYSGFLPGYSEACGDVPMVHLLANEPHFATARNGWKAENGLSDYTMEKFHRQLEKKYGSIDKLNAVYGTAHKKWEEVLFHETPPSGRQIDPRLRGTPVWYDWIRFNHDRVNEWFTFLKTEAQKNDGGRNAPVSIKVLGYSLSTSQRDGGMDMEYLTKLQEVMGADLRCAPAGAEFYRAHEEGLEPETGWQTRFAYEWSEQVMFLDFSKSLCPDKAFYDSEWHGFGTVSWRHFALKREYVRSALWMAFTHGMSAINPWLWGRGEDGALRESADYIGELPTQPTAVDQYSRTMKELNAFAPQIVKLIPKKRDFMIYYCEEAAIQDENYTAGLQSIYEALKLLNLSVGFTTPSEIAKLDAETQTVLVPPTPYILDDSLAQLKSFSGKAVVFDAERSFIKTELGLDRNVGEIDAPYAAVPMGNPFEMLPVLREKLTPLATANPVPFEIKDGRGKDAFGVSVIQAVSDEPGKVLLMLNNFSNGIRVVNILPPKGKPFKVADLIDYRPEQLQIRMEPCDIRLLMVAVN